MHVIPSDSCHTPGRGAGPGSSLLFPRPAQAGGRGADSLRLPREWRSEPETLLSGGSWKQPGRWWCLAGYLPQHLAAELTVSATNLHVLRRTWSFIHPVNSRGALGGWQVLGTQSRTEQTRSLACGTECPVGSQQVNTQTDTPRSKRNIFYFRLRGMLSG